MHGFAFGGVACNWVVSPMLATLNVTQLDLILIKPKLEQTGRSFPPEPTDYSCEPEGGAPALTVVGWLALDVVTFLALTASTHGPRVASECSDCFSLARKATFPPLNISLKFNYAKVGCRDIRRITSCKDSQSLLDCIHTGPVLWICSLVCLFTKWLRRSIALLSLLVPWGCLNEN